MYDEWYVNVALTDAKNKQYEVWFNHPDNRIKVGCKHSYTMNGKDAFIYRTYFKGRCVLSETPKSRTHCIADVLRFIKTPIEDMIDEKRL